MFVMSVTVVGTNLVRRAFRVARTANAVRGGSVARVAWALWLSAPIGATVLAALWAWWRGGRARRRAVGRRLDTADAMQAHRAYLDALTVPARGTHRVPARAEPPNE